MFAGIDYQPQALPSSFFSVLLSIQFTETALLIFLIGVLFVAIMSYLKQIDWKLCLIVGVWFLTPILAATILNPTFYDNFRHFLFAIPPIFIIGSVGIQSLVEGVKNLAGSLLLVTALILPGIVGIIRLHPYEYIYYNSIVGGTSGATAQLSGIVKSSGTWGTPPYAQGYFMVNNVTGTFLNGEVVPGRVWLGACCIGLGLGLHHKSAWLSGRS